MGLWTWLKSLWKKEDDLDLVAKVMTLDIARQGHAQVINDCMERLDHNEDFKHIVANAFTKHDDRLEALEKAVGFLYEKIQEVEGRVNEQHERIEATEFHVLKHEASAKSSQN